VARTFQSLALTGLSVLLAASLVGCQGGEESTEMTPGSEATGAPATTAGGTMGDAVAGQALYEANCATCHGANGEGVPQTFPPLAGAEQVNGSADEHIKIVLNGLSGPITVKGEEYNGFMTPFKHLSDKEIADIITFERTSWGNTGGGVTDAQVKALRQ
jgi:mono/diheme cytochrome c family protein